MLAKRITPVLFRTLLVIKAINKAVESAYFSNFQCFLQPKRWHQFLFPPIKEVVRNTNKTA